MGGKFVPKENHKGFVESEDETVSILGISAQMDREPSFKPHFEQINNRLIVSEEERIYIKRKELIKQFSSDFFTKHHIADPQFEAILHLLLSGADPYQIIEELLKFNKSLRDELIEIRMSSL